MDNLLLEASADPHYQALAEWYRRAQREDGLHEFIPDYHRLQIEYWLWLRRDELRGKSVFDIGAHWPRRYLGTGYKTVGNTPDTESDVLGDLVQLADYIGRDIADAIICTEVLEHCLEPQRAVGQMYAVLKPGGSLLVTSPMVWPWHGTHDFPDYWRFTHQGWGRLVADAGFVELDITECAWLEESQALLDLIRRFEGWGFRENINAATGYLVAAKKGEA